jgi:hypothetical protein
MYFIAVLTDDWNTTFPLHFHFPHPEKISLAINVRVKDPRPVWTVQLSTISAARPL